MRVSQATGLSTCVLALALGFAMASAAVPTTAMQSAPPAAPSPPAPAAPAAPADGSDAAAKHAKRTACLQEARSKKLVGAARTAYVKNCVANP
jgi:hypothetical protein